MQQNCTIYVSPKVYVVGRATVHGVPDKVDRLSDDGVAMCHCVIVSDTSKRLDTVRAGFAVEDSLNCARLVTTLQDESQETVIFTIACGANSNCHQTQNKLEEALGERKPPPAKFLQFHPCWIGKKSP